MSEKELKNKFGKKVPFAAPDNYFAQFPERLRTRMASSAKPEKPGRTVSLLQMIRSQAALAAAILGFALISYLAIRFFTGRTGEPGYADLVAGVEYYLDDYFLNDLIEDMPGELLEEEDSDDYDQEIMDYLLKEDITATSIVDE